MFLKFSKVYDTLLTMKKTEKKKYEKADKKNNNLFGLSI